MIGSLRGTLLRVDGNTALIEAGGVGYEVEMPSSCLQALPQDPHEPAFVYIHHSVREDAQVLYGFTDIASRSLFRILIKVNGVGPKSALAVLSTFDVQSFIAAVLDGRAAELQRIPGVGKKTAERMIVELKDSLSKLGSGAAAAAPKAAKQNSGAFDNAEAALAILGYRESLAVEYCKAAYSEGMSTEDLIKGALALISKSGRP